jgi:hypothetical protein
MDRETLENEICLLYDIMTEDRARDLGARLGELIEAMYLSLKTDDNIYFTVVLSKFADEFSGMLGEIRVKHFELWKRIEEFKESERKNGQKNKKAPEGH